MAETAIEWTRGDDGSPGRTWNPVRGCSRVSTGCENCYAERQGARLSSAGLAYDGLVRIGKQGPRWTGRVVLVPEHLGDPLRWKKGRRIFVNSMSDLFHEKLTDEEIAAVFGVMGACQQHTFQILTKRPKRMLDWFRGIGAAGWAERRCNAAVARYLPNGAPQPLDNTWPLPNVWLGVSVEDQTTADERIPLLLETPAATWFVSYEPALGPVDFSRWLEIARLQGGSRRWLNSGFRPELGWIIVGGESGPGARPFDLAWARAVLEQCRAAQVPAFIKQLGSDPILEPGPISVHCSDTKGGDPDEWPADLRVREFPQPRTR